KHTIPTAGVLYPPHGTDKYFTAQNYENHGLNRRLPTRQPHSSHIFELLSFIDR
ncbi:hypothetical protein ACJ73_10304, partial [Blastomyces percursus]